VVKEIQRPQTVDPIAPYLIDRLVQPAAFQVIGSQLVLIFSVLDEKMM